MVSSLALGESHTISHGRCCVVSPAAAERSSLSPQLACSILSAHTTEELPRAHAHCVSLPRATVFPAGLVCSFIPLFCFAVRRYGITGLLGIHWRTRATSPQIAAMAKKSWAPELTSESFWPDWTAAQFGVNSTVAALIASIFDSVDSFKLPLVVSWGHGPGQIKPGCAKPDPTRFAFVAELEAFRGSVAGAANLERFEYWVSSFRFMESVPKFACSWFEFNAAMSQASKVHDPAARKKLTEATAVPSRIAMVGNASVMMTWLQQVGRCGVVTDVVARSAHAFTLTPKYVNWCLSDLRGVLLNLTYCFPTMRRHCRAQENWALG